MQRTQDSPLSLLCPKKGGLFENFSCPRKRICGERAEGRRNDVQKSGEGTQRDVSERVSKWGDACGRCHPRWKGGLGGKFTSEGMEKSCHCLRLHFLPSGRMGLEMELEF